MYLEGLHGAISCGLSGWAILGSRVSYLFYHLESGGMCVDAESFDSFRSFVCKWIVYGSVGLCSGFLMKWIVGWYVLYSNPPPSEVKKVISGRLPFFGASEWRFVHIEEQGWISGSSHAHRTSQHSAWGSEVCMCVFSFTTGCSLLLLQLIHRPLLVEACCAPIKYSSLINSVALPIR